MLKIYHDSKISNFNRCHICFALGKVSEDLEEYDKAFKYFSEGNALRKKILRYDIDQDIEFFNALRLCYSRFMGKSVEIDHSSQSVKPIFIVPHLCKIRSPPYSS